jgi:hypothetical protein
MKKKDKQRTIIKRLRFEVFERDKFTCQDCGKKVPDVILKIIRIKPKLKGQADEILNFKTSCYECNQDSSNIQLDQGDLRKEKKEQIESMIKWQESLTKLYKNTSIKVIEYIENKINLCLNESEKRSIEKLIHKFDFPDILEAVDISAAKYLKYDTENKLIEDSIEDFINKIGGILNIKSRPPIEQKLAYIKGICRNKFNFWDDRKGSIILNAYVNALKEYGCAEKQILEDLVNELEPKTKELENWSEWRDLVEGWTKDIKKWKKE